MTEKRTTETSCDVQQTQETVSDLYKNVTMAQNCVKTLLPYVREQSVTKALHKQVEQYDNYVEQLDAVSKNLEFDPTPAPKALVVMANVGIKAKMLADKSTTHAAKIMLQGTLNGIIDLYRMQKRGTNVHPDVLALEKQILRYEETKFENLKDWL